MPSTEAMTQHAPLPGTAGDEIDRALRPGVCVRGRALPGPLQQACEELFVDADRHGPRRAALARRALPTALLLPMTLAATTFGHWRGWVLDHASTDGANLLLVVPVLVALVAFAASLAPLARVRIGPLLGGGLVLLAIGGWLVTRGEIVWASIPSSGGALFVGIAAARAVRRAVWTLPLLVAAGVSDAQSVAFGVTDRLLDGAGSSGAVRTAATVRIPADLVQRIDLLVLHIPVANGTWLLGIVDVVAIGMLLGLAHLYWLPLGRTAAALAIALTTAVIMGGVVPVLPLLGAAWLIANAKLVWRSTRFSLRRLTYLGG